MTLVIGESMKKQCYIYIVYCTRYGGAILVLCGTNAELCGMDAENRDFFARPSHPRQVQKHRPDVSSGRCFEMHTVLGAVGTKIRECSDEIIIPDLISDDS